MKLPHINPIVFFVGFTGFSGLVSVAFFWNTRSFYQKLSDFFLRLLRLHRNDPAAKKGIVSSSGHKLISSSTFIKIGSHEHIEKVLLEDDVTHLHVVADFDHTLTSHDSKQCHNTLLNYDLMPLSFNEEMSRLLDFSSPMLENKPLSFWWEYVHELLISHGITEKQMTELLGKESQHIKLRAGAKSLLEELHRLHVPITIVSAGFTHIIEEVLRLENIPMDNIRILSNKLLFENGVVFGSHPSTPIYYGNKHDTYGKLQAWFDGEAELAEEATENRDSSKTNISNSKSTGTKRRLLVIGDSVGDVTAAANIPAGSKLHIGFFKEKPHRYTREEFENAYDVILPIDESFDWFTKELQNKKYTKRTHHPKEKKDKCTNI